MDISPSQFKERFPEFIDIDDAEVARVCTLAGCILRSNKVRYSCCEEDASMLMIAHMLEANRASTAGVVTSATVEQVSVTLARTSGSGPFLGWLGKTKYGEMLAALLASSVVAPMYFSGARGVNRLPC